MSKPNTIPELIDAFGGPTKFAKVIDKEPSTASEMKRSGSIRVIYWPRIVEAASEHDVEGVTFDKLTEMHQVKTSPSESETTS
jgi:hypothetical protein